MSNPARELADLFEKWSDGAAEKTIIGARGPGTRKPTPEVWEETRRALELLSAFEARVDQLEATGAAVTHYRSQIAPMYHAIFAPDVQWSAAKSAAHGTLAADRLAMLRITADAWSNVSLDTSTYLERVIGRLQSAHDLVSGIEDTSVTRNHLLWQIELALRFARNMERYGATVVSETVSAVISEATAYAGTEGVNDEERTLLEKITWDLGVNLMAAGILQTAMLAGPHIPEIIRAITRS